VYLLQSVEIAHNRSRIWLSIFLDNGVDMNRVSWLILFVLVVLHHDFWFWSDSTLIAGWLPIGLAYHMGLTLVAVAFWCFVVKTAWPSTQPEASSGDEGSAS